MVIEYNKKIKVVSPKPHFNGGNSNPIPTSGKPNSKPQQVHLHEKDHPTENQWPQTPTQTMVHECLTERGTDPSDIHNVMSVFNAKVALHLKIPQERFKFIKDKSLPEPINLLIIWLIGELMED